MVEIVFVDTNIFISLLNDDKPLDAYLMLRDSKYHFCTSHNVLNELKYIILTKMGCQKTGNEKKYDILKVLKKDANLRTQAIDLYFQVYSKIKAEMTILEITSDIEEDSSKLIVEYGLLPTDALIASLMRHHEISIIYSDDHDFDKIPWIKRIGLEK